MNKSFSKEKDMSLTNFALWVASKSAPKQQISNVLQFRPKHSPNPRHEKNNQLNLRPSFFNTPKKEASLFAKAKDLLNKMNNQQQPDINLSCNNCGEMGHNSASCYQPTHSQPKA